MACATLKRTLDWESLNQRPTKRRRCNPFGQSGSSSPSRSATTSTASAAAGHDGLAGTINPQSPSGRFAKEPQPSPFTEANLTKMSPGQCIYVIFHIKFLIKIFTDKMAQNIRDEIKRLHRRKQLPFSAAAIERMQDSESSGSEMGPDSPRRPDSPPSIVRNPEKALFTFKQVSAKL